MRRWLRFLARVLLAPVERHWCLVACAVDSFKARSCQHRRFELVVLQMVLRQHVREECRVLVLDAREQRGALVCLRSCFAQLCRLVETSPSLDE